MNKQRIINRVSVNCVNVYIRAKRVSQPFSAQRLLPRKLILKRKNLKVAMYTKCVRTEYVTGYQYSPQTGTNALICLFHVLKHIAYNNNNNEKEKKSKKRSFNVQHLLRNEHVANK